MESISAYLSDASDEELDALAAAAKRGLAEEQSSNSSDDLSREDVVEAYANWMEGMFGDGWEGNDRV